VDNADTTLFQKHTNVFTDPGDRERLRLFISATKQIGVTFANENHSVSSPKQKVVTVNEGVDGTSTFTAIEKDTWYYLVFSFEMKDMINTEITFFINNVASAHGVKTVNESFIIDKTTYKSLLGIE
jgi:hypothetical protein